MSSEPTITINGHTLTQSQTWALRNAVQMLHAQALMVVAQSPADKPMVATKVQRTCAAVLSLMLGPDASAE